MKKHPQNIKKQCFLCGNIFTTAKEKPHWFCMGNIFCRFIKKLTKCNNQTYYEEGINEIINFIQSEIDTAIAEEREKTLREIHDWAYRKGSELSHEDRIKGFQAVVDYTKHHFKYNKKQQ